MSSLGDLDPRVRDAVRAIGVPEVRTMIERLAEYGLAVAVPHMHGDANDFGPLPADMVSMENNLKVSFVRREDVDWESATAVMWRWDADKRDVAVAAGCGLECKVK